MTTQKRRMSLILLVGVIGLSVVGCAAGPGATSQPSSMPEMLQAAGFKPYTADTPQRLAYLKSCPKDVLVTHERRSQVCYAFTDAATNTVYLGDAAAYSRLQDALDAQQKKIETQMQESNPEFWSMWEDRQGGG